MKKQSSNQRPFSAPIQPQSPIQKVKKNIKKLLTKKKASLNITLDQKVPERFSSPTPKYNAQTTKVTSKRLNNSMRVNNNKKTSIVKTTKNNSYQKLPSRSSTPVKSTLFSPDALELELQLTDMLKGLNETEASDVMTQNKIKVFQTVFEKIIDRDKIFGGILMKIHQAYKQALIQVNFQGVNESSTVQVLQKDLKKVKQALLIEKEDRKLVDKKIELLSRENLNLSRSLEERENQLEKLSNTIKRLNKQEITYQTKKNEENWNYLIQENQQLTEYAKALQYELKTSKKREYEISKLLKALKSKGVPVEEIYEQEVKGRSSTSSIKSSQRVNDTSEMSPAFPKKIKQNPQVRPTCVPPLNFQKLYNSDTDNSEMSAISEIENKTETLFSNDVSYL